MTTDTPHRPGPAAHAIDMAHQWPGSPVSGALGTYHCARPDCPCHGLVTVALLDERDHTLARGLLDADAAEALGRSMIESAARLRRALAGRT